MLAPRRGGPPRAAGGTPFPPHSVCLGVTPRGVSSPCTFEGLVGHPVGVRSHSRGRGSWEPPTTCPC